MSVLVYDVPHAAIADAEPGDVGAVATLTVTSRFAALFLPGSYGPVGLLTFGPAVAVTGGATLPALTASATLTEKFTVTGGATIPALTASGTLTTYTAQPGITTATFAPTGLTTGTFAPTGTTTGVQGP